jgi:hypothetical protein
MTAKPWRTPVDAGDGPFKVRVVTQPGGYEAQIVNRDGYVVDRFFDHSREEAMTHVAREYGDQIEQEDE